MDKNKKMAVEFLEMIMTGAIAEAYEKYVDMSGKHHHAFAPSGFPALKESMIEADAKFPNKKLEIKHVVGDNDLVAVHSGLTLDTNLDFVAAHLLRFENDKIVELWDLNQAIAAEKINTDGPF